MLKPDPTTRTIIVKLLVPSSSSSRGCRGGILGGIVNYDYNLLFYNVAETSAALLLSFLLY